MTDRLLSCFYSCLCCCCFLPTQILYASVFRFFFASSKESQNVDCVCRISFQFHICFCCCMSFVYVFHWFSVSHVVDYICIFFLSVNLTCLYLFYAILSGIIVYMESSFKRNGVSAMVFQFHNVSESYYE